MRRVAIPMLALATLAACTNPAPRKPGSNVQADAATPRTCREWTIDTATLTCSADVMKANYDAANAKRIAAAEDKLSRYGPLGDQLCKDAAGARDTRDKAVEYARSNALTHVELDRMTQASAVVALCHDTVIKIVSRGEEDARGRKVLADLHPNVDDTPKDEPAN